MSRFAKRSAFTLIELLVVMVVLAVLAAIVIPRFYDQTRRAKESSMRIDLKHVRDAMSRMQIDTGLAPIALSDLTASTAPTQGYDPKAGLGNTWPTTALDASTWHGPYLTELPKDPVSGNDFTYDPVTPTCAFAACSSASGNGTDGTAYNTW